VVFLGRNLPKRQRESFSFDGITTAFFDLPNFLVAWKVVYPGGIQCKRIIQ